MKGKGGTQIRTGGRGFADLGLTTWLCRQNSKDKTSSRNSRWVCILNRLNRDCQRMVTLRNRIEGTILTTKGKEFSSV